MLNKLRLRFIVLNMILALLVLVFAFGAICLLDYQQRVVDIYGALTQSLDKAQTPSVAQIEKLLPLINSSTTANAQRAETSSVNTEPVVSSNSNNENTENAPETEPTSSAASTAQKSSSSASAIEIGGGYQTAEAIIPVAVYLVKADGSYTALGNFANASISHSVLLESNEYVMKSDHSQGEVPKAELFYERRSASNGTLIAYADKSTADSWQNLAITLAGVGSLALVAFLIINIFFSKWALRPVKYAWKQQTQFVADASHELKTPLAVILANISIVKSHPENKVGEEAQWIDSTLTEAQRMQNLVNDMLEMARPEDASKAELQLEDLDFSDLVEGEVLQFESVAFERGVELESDIEEELEVEGSRTRLQRMVSTLIDNACKYSDGEKPVRVELTTEKQPGRIEYAVFSVNNSGTPISSEDLPHVFDRFYRADKARTSGKGGYGLGLAIAREIVLEHDGDISVKSGPTSGTTFTVKLPTI